MRAGRLLVALAWGSAILLGASPTAHAHKFQVRRTLFLEPSGARTLEVVVSLRVPAGQARQALELLADQDRDGRLSAPELRVMRGILAARALDGLALWAGSSTLSVARPEVKLATEPGGPIELMVHGVATLPGAPDPARAAPPTAGLELGVSTGPLGDPLELRVLPGTRPVRSAPRGRVRQGGLEVALGQGDRVRWTIP